MLYLLLDCLSENGQIIPNYVGQHMFFIVVPNCSNVAKFYTMIRLNFGIASI